MRIRFVNADAFADGIALIAPDLGFAATDDADLTVTAAKAADDTLTVTLDGASAVITCTGRARFFRGLALLCDAVRRGETAFSRTEAPLFRANGAMVDMSRNAVMNVRTVQFMLRRMALMGLSTFMLYTEDTYEIDGRPYFGYMRGRYTAEEIRALDDYAAALGIELIPCIQTLGHLATHLRWSAAAPYKDTANALLAGAEETYRLIDDMLRTVAACFRSRRIHIGMDETHDLGTGRSLDQQGYIPRRDLYFAHLGRVAELCRKYGFRPMMWSDMFFRMSAAGMAGYSDYDVRTVLPDDIDNCVPEGVQQVFWDYYHPEEEFYRVNLEKHRLLGSDTVFAGGVWTWSGHCPHYSRSLRHTIPALEACRKAGTGEVLATVWHNGAESCLIMALAGLAWYADYDYRGRYDEDGVRETFRAACGLEYDDFLLTELPEYPHGGTVGISRSLVYNDPLIGLIDAHLAGLDTGCYYRDVCAQLAGKGGGEFSPAFDVIRALADLLVEKADFGVRLKAAYDRDDRTALAALADECETIRGKLDVLRTAHRDAWMRYCKPFGWEVHDIRYGGLMMRFDTARTRITAYLVGEIDAIEELAEPRLRFDCREDSDPFGGRFVWHKYQAIATAGVL